MDEIGRGTSTFDGLSLAWAIARHIATKVQAFTLFATHYFELTTLAREVEGCVNVHLDATEHGEGIVFLHAVKEGPASRSYGLQVAQLAGVPREVIQRARNYLAALETERDTTQGREPRRESWICSRAPRPTAEPDRCGRGARSTDPGRAVSEGGARSAVSLERAADKPS